MNFAVMEAHEISHGYASGLFSPVEVTRALLDRIEKLNPKLNAFYVVDSAKALEAARAAESRWLKHKPLGTLDGIPTSVKDALPSIGHQSFRGSAAHPSEVKSSETDAPAVARMREAGMIFLGKTTMPDFGILPGSVSSKHGITRNPWNLAFTAGGSSSGAASSIAGGLNPLAVGTDIVGSIRLPASFCGIFGFKPSQGRVPYYFPNSPSLVAGPMARSVRDAALLMNVLAQPDARDFTALPATAVDYLGVLKEPCEAKQLAVIESLGFEVRSEDQVTTAFRDRVELLEQAGFRITRLEPKFTGADLRQAELFYKIRCRTEFLGFTPEQQQKAETIQRWSAEADRASATDFHRVFTHIQLMREKAARLIEGYDYLLLPSVPRPPFPAELAGFSAEELFQPWINTFLFNLSEQPGSSLPCGQTTDGLPIGLQIIGHRFDDIGVLKLSGALERLFPWRLELDAMTEALGPEG